MPKFFFALVVSFLALAAPVRAQLYQVNNGVATHDKRDRDALLVQVDGSVETTREFWQDYMKDTYSIRFKSGALATLGIKGKKDELSAQDVSGAGISSRPVTLYVNLNAINDSTTEVAFFGGFGDKTYFEPTRTVPEFKALRKIMDKFAVAARANAYQVQVKEAERDVSAADKEQDKLNRSIQSAQSNTAANLKRIDELISKNRSNALQMHQDSLQLTTNAQLRELTRTRLQRRRDRLATVDKK
ncbi:hypothetical protein [Hymenobacter bucti]|uniref:DUF4468 domain-containing protein n=1 Tax=Hymenobacter bucti TaxID=1844114 RepID=A0ABW4QP84_9BACT